MARTKIARPPSLAPLISVTLCVTKVTTSLAVTETVVGHGPRHASLPPTTLFPSSPSRRYTTADLLRQRLLFAEGTCILKLASRPGLKRRSGMSGDPPLKFKQAPGSLSVPVINVVQIGCSYRRSVRHGDVQRPSGFWVQ